MLQLFESDQNLLKLPMSGSFTYDVRTQLGPWVYIDNESHSRSHSKKPLMGLSVSAADATGKVKSNDENRIKASKL